MLICCFATTLGCGPDLNKSAATTPNQPIEETQQPSGPDLTPTVSPEPAAQAVGQTKVEAPEEPNVIAETTTEPAFSIRLLAWNVESEGADSEVIGNQLAKMKGYDIYALCEVLPQDFSLFRDSLGKNYKYAYSKSGYNDRLQLLYNEDRFELLRHMELNEINFEQKYRSPLVIHLRDRETKQEFMVLNNHLARGKAEVRTRQAEQLVEWARDQNLPMIAVGDYNFDFVFSTEKGNEGFDAMLRDNIWKWVRPTELIDTNWYDPEQDGVDNFPGSILDFAFVAGPASVWDTTFNVIVRDGDFPDNETTSDHRPVELLISRPQG